MVYTNHLLNNQTALHGPMTMSELLATLSPLEQEFFEAVDRELIKVENFYREREREALIRSAVIKEQLNELRDHRRIFHVSTAITSLLLIQCSAVPRCLSRPPN